MEDFYSDSDTYNEIIDIGRRKEAKSIILRLGTIRFGTPDETIKMTVNAIEDLERLQRLEDRVFDASNWQEVVDTP